MSAHVDSATPFTAPAPVPAAVESVPERAERIFRDGPRRDDYLVVPAEVRAFVDSEVRRILVEDDVVINPETVRWMLSKFTLQHYYAGQVVVTLRTPDGVVVLAAGDDEVTQYLRRPGRQPFPGTCMENP